MSRKKDRDRANQELYRDGQKVSRADWDKHQRELRELAEEQRLKALGLVPSRKVKPKLLIATRRYKV